MRTKRAGTGILRVAIPVVGILFLNATAWAHCDTMSGPVIVEAKAALEKGDVAPVLKWVKPDDETAIRTAFAKAVVVRAKGPEARDLADQYFLETLVRLHRAGEGASFTSLKDEPVEPIVAMADKALADGSAEELIGSLNSHLAQAIRERFQRAEEAGRHKEDSVEAGRAYVEAYVGYVHFVEGIHAAILTAGEHHREGTTEGDEAAPSEHPVHRE